MLFFPFACSITCDVQRPSSVSRSWLCILALVGPIAICITPPGLWFDVVVACVLSIESAMENLLLGHITLICARSGIVEFSGFLQFNFVSVKPIIVGSSVAAFVKRSLRSMWFCGKPLMFCNMMRSRSGGRGIIGVGPHVMFVRVGCSVVSCVPVGGCSVSLVVLLLVSVFVCGILLLFVLV